MIGPQENSIAEIQESLDKNFPSPEEDLIHLSLTLARSPEGEPYIETRFLVLEVDNLIAQLRWHLGQVILLAKRHLYVYEVTKEGNTEQETGELRFPKEMPTRSQLLLRGYIARPEQVLFADLSEKYRGGTVAGWIYHMMIDDAVARSLAILDRLARIISLIANVHFDKVYFRSGKLKVIHEHLKLPETQRLLKLSESGVFNLLLEYRDGWNHKKLTYSDIAGFMPVDSYIDNFEQYVRIVSDQFSGELLTALVRAAYDQIIQALHEVCLICEQKVPNEERQYTPHPLARDKVSEEE